MPTNKTSRSIVSSSSVENYKWLRDFSFPVVLHNARKAALLELTLLTFAKFILFATMLFQQSLFSQEVIDYSEIKALLERRDFISAQRKINLLLPNNPSDPDLLYFQAETWFQKAEFNYRKENYNTAYDLYKQALTIWPNHYILNERITTLSKKSLIDSSPKQENSSIEQQESNCNKENGIYIFLNENFSKVEVQSIEKSGNSKNSAPFYPIGYAILRSGNNAIILIKPIALGLLMIWITLISVLSALSIQFIIKYRESKSS